MGKEIDAKELAAIGAAVAREFPRLPVDEQYAHIVQRVRDGGYEIISKAAGDASLVSMSGIDLSKTKTRIEEKVAALLVRLAPVGVDPTPELKREVHGEVLQTVIDELSADGMPRDTARMFAAIMSLGLRVSVKEALK